MHKKKSPPNGGRRLGRRAMDSGDSSAFTRNLTTIEAARQVQDFDPRLSRDVDAAHFGIETARDYRTWRHWMARLSELEKQIPDAEDEGNYAVN